MDSWKRALDFSFLSMILLVVSVLVCPVIPTGNYIVTSLLVWATMGLSILFAALSIRILTREGKAAHE